MFYWFPQIPNFVLLHYMTNHVQLQSLTGALNDPKITIATDCDTSNDTPYASLVSPSPKLQCYLRYGQPFKSYWAL